MKAFVLILSSAVLLGSQGFGSRLSPIPHYSGPYVVLTYGDRDADTVYHECRMMMGKAQFVRWEKGQTSRLEVVPAPSWSVANEVSLAQWSRIFSAASFYPLEKGIPSWSIYTNQTVSIYFGVVSETDPAEINPPITEEEINDPYLGPSIYDPREFHGLPSYTPRVPPTTLLSQKGRDVNKSYYLNGGNAAFIAEFYPQAFCGERFNTWVNNNR